MGASFEWVSKTIKCLHACVCDNDTLENDQQPKKHEQPKERKKKSTQ